MCALVSVMSAPFSVIELRGSLCGWRAGGQGRPSEWGAPVTRVHLQASLLALHAARPRVGADQLRLGVLGTRIGPAGLLTKRHLRNGAMQRTGLGELRGAR